METYKQEFIEFMAGAGVLRFGEFMTKSGRQTPFFINTGLFSTGLDILQLGRNYAHVLTDRLGSEFDVLSYL